MYVIDVYMDIPALGNNMMEIELSHIVTIDIVIFL